METKVTQVFEILPKKKESSKRRLKGVDKKWAMRTLKGRSDGPQEMTAWSPGNPRGNKTPFPKLPFLEWGSVIQLNQNEYICTEMHLIINNLQHTSNINTNRNVWYIISGNSERLKLLPHFKTSEKFSTSVELLTARKNDILNKSSKNRRQLFMC